MFFSDRRLVGAEVRSPTLVHTYVTYIHTRGSVFSSLSHQQALEGVHTYMYVGRTCIYIYKPSSTRADRMCLISIFGCILPPHASHVCISCPPPSGQTYRLRKLFLQRVSILITAVASRLLLLIFVQISMGLHTRRKKTGFRPTIGYEVFISFRCGICSLRLSVSPSLPLAMLDWHENRTCMYGGEGAISRCLLHTLSSLTLSPRLFERI